MVSAEGVESEGGGMPVDPGIPCEGIYPKEVMKAPCKDLLALGMFPQPCW